MNFAVRHAWSSVLVASLVLVPAGASTLISGCSVPIVGADAGPADTGTDGPTDAPERGDVPMVLMDALPGVDAPDAPPEPDTGVVVDAPPGIDAPAMVDAPPAADAPAAVDAPTGVDAPAAADAGAAVDAPAALDAGTDGGPMCGATQHVCSGSCVSNMSILSCGVSSCDACIPPSDSVATCDGTSCGFMCDGGFHACGSECRPDDDATACGAACTVCTVPANGSAVCVAGACDITCAAPYVRAGSTCSVMPPRPIGPLSTENVTTRRPVLRWSLPAGVDGARVQVCSDRACTLPIYQADFVGSTGTVATSLPVRVSYWRLFGRIGTATGTVPSVTWQFTVSGNRVPTYSTSHGPIADYNGDGYADLTGTAASGAGTVSVFPGGPSGVPPFPSLVLGDGMVASGDVNGDGYGDLVASDGPTDIRVYFGSSTGLRSTVSQRVTVGHRGGPVYVGDLDGNGYGEVAVGGPGTASIAWGSASGLGSPSLLPGPWTPPDSGTWGTVLEHTSSIAGGDLDGDGLSDLVIGAATYGGNVGRIAVYRGTSSGLEATASEIPSPRPGSFGQHVRVGDVTGDGLADVVSMAGTCCASTLYVFAGTPSGVSLTPASSTSLGAAVLFEAFGVGDFGGDGFADAVVIAQDTSAGGPARAYVFPGSATGLGAAATSYAAATGSYTSLAAWVGDVDGDGFQDFGVREYISAGGSGLDVFRGGATLPATPSWRAALYGVAR